jgi:hypothetical protein
MFIALIALIAMQPPAEPPVVGQPTEGYYHAVGEHVRIELSISSPEVEVEEPITLTLKITGADNPDKILRPDLSKIPDFADQFHIDNLPDLPAQAGRIFQYKLRPKNEQVKDVPPLLFKFWDPKLESWQATAPQSPLPLAVTPRAPQGSGAPLQDPDFLYKMVPTSDIMKRPTSDEIRFGGLIAAVVVPLFIFEVWFLIWRRMRPSAAKLAQIRRTRAVRAALDALKILDGVPAPALADRSAEIVRTYTEDRFGLAAKTMTPEEIAAEFTRMGMPPSKVDRTKAFFQLCDAVRFGPPENQRQSLSAAAERLVLTLENAV